MIDSKHINNPLKKLRRKDYDSGETSTLDASILAMSGDPHHNENKDPSSPIQIDLD
jgi:hypothetical protein